MTGAAIPGRAYGAAFAARITRTTRGRKPRHGPWKDSSTACGMWLKWGMVHDSMGMRIQERGCCLGTAETVGTTAENTAAGSLQGVEESGDMNSTNAFLATAHTMQEVQEVSYTA
ncbi:hypothetical protein GGR52DRAFT_434043 [Hypoxylon sp. FL1284]|nr:hypothetical protein GGR52DRAFT_434043 [Hypoxylon sp. FL1284]